MADYLISGQRGAGKGIVIASRIQQYLKKGRIVATNMDLNLAYMLPHTNKTARVYRVPDFPKGEEIAVLGNGGDSCDESRFGGLFLDELAVWLNSRGWNDKDRQSLLEWLPLSRKFRWNTYFTTQLLASLDKQVRELLEHRVNVIRLDRLPIPLLGGIIRFFFGSLAAKLPRLHIGVVTYGTGPAAMLVEKWAYRGNDNIRQSYNTEQKYSKDYPHGTYCMLPPWYLVDRTGYWTGDRYISFPLYHSPDGVLYGWPGRPEGWDKEPPLRPSRPVPITQPLYDLALLLTQFFRPVLHHFA